MVVSILIFHDNTKRLIRNVEKTSPRKGVVLDAFCTMTFRPNVLESMIKGSLGYRDFQPEFRIPNASLAKLREGIDDRSTLPVSKSRIRTS